MSDFASELAHLMAVRKVGVRELARMVPCNPGHISNLRSGRGRPSPELAEVLDRRLEAGGALASLVPAPAPRRPAISGWGELAMDDEIAALDLARRAEISEVGAGTVERLELAVDELAIAYPGTTPAELLDRVRAYLTYVGRLLAARKTLTEQRRLLVVGGWMSLLAATTLIDLHRDQAGAAYLRTAARFAQEAGHAEITAWCLETQAWQVLTKGDYRRAVEISRDAQRVAPKTGSAYIQATAQQGRAWARLGDAGETRTALGRLETLVSPLAMPDQPEHHYRYDPPKAEIFTATTLAWLGDPGCEGLARQVLAAIEAPGERPRPRRAAIARLDLALALTSADQHDEAAGVALAAVQSGRLAPVDGARAREVINAVARRGVPEATGLAEAYRAYRPEGGQLAPPA